MVYGFKSWLFFISFSGRLLQFQSAVFLQPVYPEDLLREAELECLRHQRAHVRLLASVDEIVSLLCEELPSRHVPELCYHAVHRDDAAIGPSELFGSVAFLLVEPVHHVSERLEREADDGEVADDMVLRLQVDREAVQVRLHRPEAVLNLPSHPRGKVQVLRGIAEVGRLDIVSQVSLGLVEGLLVDGDKLLLCDLALGGGMVAVQESPQLLWDGVQSLSASGKLPGFSSLLVELPLLQKIVFHGERDEKAREDSRLPLRLLFGIGLFRIRDRIFRVLVVLRVVGLGIEVRLRPLPSLSLSLLRHPLLDGEHEPCVLVDGPGQDAVGLGMVSGCHGLLVFPFQVRGLFLFSFGIPESRVVHDPCLHIVGDRRPGYWLRRYVCPALLRKVHLVGEGAKARIRADDDVLHRYVRVDRGDLLGKRGLLVPVPLEDEHSDDESPLVYQKAHLDKRGEYSFLALLHSEELSLGALGVVEVRAVVEIELRLLAHQLPDLLVRVGVDLVAVPGEDVERAVDVLQCDLVRKRDAAIGKVHVALASGVQDLRADESPGDRAEVEAVLGLRLALQRVELLKDPELVEEMADVDRSQADVVVDAVRLLREDDGGRPLLPLPSGIGLVGLPDDLVLVPEVRVLPEDGDGDGGGARCRPHRFLDVDVAGLAVPVVVDGYLVSSFLAFVAFEYLFFHGLFLPCFHYTIYTTYTTRKICT